MTKTIAGAACIAALSLAFADAACAQSDTRPAPFREFTFKRVAPPAPGATKRITVQIAPKGETGGEQADAQAPASRSQSGTGDVGAFPWFWDALSPDASASAPGRLFDALDVIEAAPEAPVPRLQSLQSIVDAHGRAMLGATVGTRVSPALVLAVISVESGGNAVAESSAGARGLMQLMPATAARFGVSDVTDPAENIKGGVAFLDHLIGAYDADPLLVLAAYNAGEGAVATHDGVPPFVETRNYVPKVLAAYRVARGLCLTPPLMLSDGCVFAQGGG